MVESPPLLDPHSEAKIVTLILRDVHKDAIIKYSTCQTSKIEYRKIYCSL